MTDREALLAAILADPGDDALRLVYADCLEEEGEAERAAFVRQRGPWEFEFRGNWTAFEGSPRGSLHHELLRSLPRPGGESLYRYSPPVEESAVLAVTLRHGFVSAAKCPLAYWLEHGPALAAAHPLGRVTLADADAIREDVTAGGQEWEVWTYRVFTRPPPGADALIARIPAQHDSREAVLGAISRGCIAWAKATAAGASGPRGRPG